MTDFDPLKTREEQGLEPIPAWLLSERLQAKMLANLGLRTSAPNVDGWTTMERIPVESDISGLPTLCKHGVDIRGDRKEAPVCAECAGRVK